MKEKGLNYTKSISYKMFGKRNRDLNTEEKRKLNAFLKAEERRKYPDRYERDKQYAMQYYRKLKNTEKGKLALMRIRKKCYEKNKKGGDL